MDSLIKSEAYNVFSNFYEINKIPRCSQKEEQISNFLLEFGKKLGLETFQDEYLNILIKKPPSKGYEEHSPVIIQAHMDMVCEKIEGSDFDFCKESIDMYVDGDYIKAHETSLGADNGIGLALALDILENKKISHPPLEVLLTSCEETTMEGAFNISNKWLSGSRMINIDSEDDSSLTIGCAGGLDAHIDLDLERENTDTKREIKIQVDGLKGGHSGLTIGSNHINALKLITEFIKKLNENIDFRISSLISGTKPNAIPTKAQITIGVDEDLEDEFIKEFNSLSNEYVESLLKREPDISFNLELQGYNDVFFREESIKKVLNITHLLPHGVNTMINDSDIVESSSNLAIGKTIDNIYRIVLSLRSSKEEEFDYMKTKIREISNIFKANLELKDYYPMWQPAETSPLREVAKMSYDKLRNDDLTISVLHAGLECGVIKEKYPYMDIISLGPNISGAHTPEEKLSIKSTEFIRKYLYEILERL